MNLKNWVGWFHFNSWLQNAALSMFMSGCVSVFLGTIVLPSTQPVLRVKQWARGEMSAAWVTPEVLWQKPALSSTPGSWPCSAWAALVCQPLHGDTWMGEDKNVCSRQPFTGFQSKLKLSQCKGTREMLHVEASLIAEGRKDTGVEP